MPTPPGQGVFQLRITLRNVEPAVWRRLLVPASVRLAKLHGMFQAAMGWTNSHLHCFTIGDERYGMQFDEYPEGEIDEKQVTVMRAIGEHPDSRTSTTSETLGSTRSSSKHSGPRPPLGLKHAVSASTGGRRVRPRTVAEPAGTRELLQALADPKHEEHDHLLDWVGGPFDPTLFDVVTVNVALQHVH